MIFVSAGTGFAPMRAFLWERLALRRHGVALGEAALFNGLRSRPLDYLYRDEVGRFASRGRARPRAHRGVARAARAPRVRPGPHPRAKARSCGVCFPQAATSTCAAPPMRDAVRAAFVDVVAQHAKMPRTGAEAFVADLENAGRYRPDLWA